ncbi:MAG: hypothetical protein PHI34_11055 [Acidobacteriota bacterium]|nr:hypothetical protein [Acidobacteriota bacterium]
MIHRRAVCLGIASVLLLAAAGAADAQERGAMSVYTNLNKSTTTVGYLFQVRVDFNFQDVDPDKVIGIRLKALYEGDDSNISKAINERMAGDWSGPGKRSGQFEVEFWVAFGKEIIPENWIQVDAYTRTKDSASQHFLADYILKLKMIPRTTLEILSVDAPKPPDTVLVGEKVPLRMKIQCVSMLPEADIFFEIQAIEGGTGYWSWRSPKMSGSSRYESEPNQVKFDTPGRWKLRAKAKTENFVAEPLEFEIEVVDAPTRVLGPVRIGYPKSPEMVSQGEKVRFDVSMDYENFPAGTKAAVIFVNPVSGKDISNAWLDSRFLGGSGTYDFGPLILTAPAPGTWEMDVTIRLPRLDKPEEFKTYYTKRVSLQVVSAAAAPAPDPTEMTAEITRIQKPSGTLKLNEIAPIFVTISYKKFGGQGVILKAEVTEKGATAVLGRADSIVLRDQGTYTFPVINVKMTRTGAFAIQVNIMGPKSRPLTGKWTDFTVVD